MSSLQVNNPPSPGGYTNIPGNFDPSAMKGADGDVTFQNVPPDLKIQKKDLTPLGGASPTGETDDIPAPSSTAEDDAVIERLELSLTNSIDALFEIYTLLQLMQECANKQRAATREARQSEYEAEKAAINRQADEIRTSAVVGLTMGIIGSVLTMGSLIASGIKLGTGVKQKLELINDSGVPDAADNLHNATGAMQGMNQKMEDFKAGLPRKAAPDAALKGGADGAAGNLDNAAVKPEVGKPEVGKPEAGKPEAGKPEAGKPEAGKPEAGKPEAGKPEAGKPEDVNKPGDTPKTPPNQLDDDIDQNAMDNKQKNEWAKLNKEYDTAKDNLTDAQNDFDRALGDLHNNPDYVQAEADMQSAQTWQTVGQAFGSLFSTLSQSLSQLISANATLEQVAQKDAEQESEQQSDLFKNAGELRQAVLQLMSAVTQVEKDSLNKIINA